MLRRSAALCSLALVLTGLSVAPARAAAAARQAPRVGGVLTEVLRGPAPTASGRAALRRQALVAGTPATQRFSTWQVTYAAGFTGHNDAKAAFQQAVDTWAGIIHSSVPIRVHADFQALGEGVLGQAGPAGFESDPSLGDGTSYYPDALADSLAGTDVFPGDYDIYAEFNSTEPGIYYGTDGNPGSGQVDFESVVLHELGHGLGFTGAASYDDRGTLSPSDDVAGFDSSPSRFVYDTFLVNGAGAKVFATGTTHALATAFTSPVYWGGSRAVAVNGTRPLLYAPNPWEDGSSLAHLDESAFSTNDVDSLMTPYLTNAEVVHRPGPVTLGMFQDMGWVTTLAAPGKVSGLHGEALNGSVQLTWTKAVENGSAITGYTASWTDNGAPGGTQQVTGTAVTIPDLTNGHSYVFTVTAANAVGTGPASEPSAPVVPTLDTDPPTVAFVVPPAVSNAKGSIVFSGSDPGHPSATLTFACGLDTVTLTPCSSPFALAGLSTGTHTLVVTAQDAAGNASSPASLTFDLDGVLPTVVLDSPLPTSPWSSTTASFAFSGSDDRSAVTALTYRCRMDAAALTTCASGVSYPSLTNGTHTFAVAAVDEAGNASASVTRSFRVDTLAPLVTANALPVFTLGSTVGLRYSAVDPSGVASYDLRYRRGAFNTGMGGLAYPSSWQGTAATVKTTLSAKGYTYCFSVRARDALGHVSAWSAERCTATALDDRALAASSGWSRATSSATYAGTVTSTTAVGRALTRTSVQARRIGLVATTCRGCGTVGVYWNGTLLRTVDLNATTTTYKRVITVADLGAIRSGTLVVTSLSTGRTYVDGVAFTRA